jgi:hypothetical protein
MDKYEKAESRSALTVPWLRIARLAQENPSRGSCAYSTAWSASLLISLCS